MVRSADGGVPDGGATCGRRAAVSGVGVPAGGGACSVRLRFAMGVGKEAATDIGKWEKDDDRVIDDDVSDAESRQRLVATHGRLRLACCPNFRNPRVRHVSKTRKASRFSFVPIVVLCLSPSCLSPPPARSSSKTYAFPLPLLRRPHANHVLAFFSRASRRSDQAWPSARPVFPLPLPSSLRSRSVWRSSSPARLRTCVTTRVCSAL